MANDTRQAVLATVPALRAVATALTASKERGDDLVEETMLRALSSAETPPSEGGLQAWLFGLLHAQYYAEHRNRRRDTNGNGAQATVPQTEFRSALAKLPAEQREALILVAGTGLPYEDVAHICGCAVGTIKSRVNRARNRLGELMTPKNSGDFGDRAVRPPMAAGSGRY